MSPLPAEACPRVTALLVLQLVASWLSTAAAPPTTMSLLLAAVVVSAQRAHAESPGQQGLRFTASGRLLRSCWCGSNVHLHS